MDTKELNKFWEQVDKSSPSGCWLFTKWLDRDGYGIFSGNRQYRAHRYSLASTGVDIKGKVVCHSCDVRNCVNPAHLFAGTQQDNIKDMVSKNRHYHSRARKSTPRKLSPEIAEQILNSKDSVNELAKRFNIHRITIYRLRKRGL